MLISATRLNKLLKGRTCNQQEIDLLELDGEHIVAMEMKSGKKSPKILSTFAKEYLDADYMVVNQDSFMGICQSSVF